MDQIPLDISNYTFKFNLPDSLTYRAPNESFNNKQNIPKPLSNSRKSDKIERNVIDSLTCFKHLKSKYT